MKTKYLKLKGPVTLAFPIKGKLTRSAKEQIVKHLTENGFYYCGTHYPVDRELALASVSAGVVEAELNLQDILIEV